MYALVIDDTIREIVGRLDDEWYDGTRWWDFSENGHDPADHGWLPLVYVDRPADTATTTWDRDEPRLIDGVPTVTWTERPKTAEELAADQAAANAQALTDVATLQGRLDRLAAYKTDPDLAAVLAQTNNQALPTASLNRALKTMIRENQRQSATLALLVRLLDPALLADVGDTTDA